MALLPPKVSDLIERTVTGLGYECVGVEMVSQQNVKLLRIYIDQPQGVVIEDCVAVSRHVSGVLDVEDPIAGNYQLEVSSPGMERPLFRVEDYQRFKGEQAQVELYEPLDGQRKVKGILAGLDAAGQIQLQVAEKTVVFSFSMIRKAKLVPEIGIGLKGS